jgi:CRP-like cAMP-binding protein
MREGQEADGLLLVDQGSLRLESARCGDLGEAGPGASLGAVSLVVVGPREVTAVASEPTRLLRLSRTAFHRLVEDSPRAAARILETLVQDFAAAVRSGLDRLA